MRLFVAIQFEESILAALKKLQAEWVSLGMRGYPTPPQNLHLTLAFIGEHGNPDEVLSAIGSAAFVPFPIRLDGIGNFGDTYWAGVAKNDALSGYVRRLRNALARHGIPYDRKRFSPHITLMRKASFRGTVDELLHSPPCGEMTVSSVSLMASTRGKNGMVYTPVGIVEP